MRWYADTAEYSIDTCLVLDIICQNIRLWDICCMFSKLRDVDFSFNFPNGNLTHFEITNSEEEVLFKIMVKKYDSEAVYIFVYDSVSNETYRLWFDSPSYVEWLKLKY